MSKLELNTHRGVQSLANCHVFAKWEHIRELEHALSGVRSSMLTMHPVAGHEPLSQEALRQARCIVLEVDPFDEHSLARLEQARRTCPATPIIAGIENADFKLTRLLVRQGVFDVVSLPFDAEEVLARVMDASAIVAAQSGAQLAPLVAVVGASGAIGATTVLTHLAAALAEHCDRECCVIDLDLQFGQVANYLGVTPPVSVLELLEAGERLDADLVRNAALDTGHGVRVLAAPRAISPLEQVDIDRLLQLLEIARRTFGFVLLDLPANWTNWTLSAVAACSEVLLVTDQSINGLRQAQRSLELFDNVDLPRDGVTLLVNRFERGLLKTISVSDIEATLNRSVRTTLAREKSGLTEAQDQGLLLHQAVRKAKFSAEIAKLAESLCETHGEAR